MSYVTCNPLPYIKCNGSATVTSYCYLECNLSLLVTYLCNGVTVTLPTIQVPRGCKEVYWLALGIA
jgi:hypothetical protein